MAKLELLRPKVMALASQVIKLSKESGIEIAITQTLRTLPEQDELYAQGRTKPGNIVTNAKGGFSLHNYGVAFDFCPLIDGKAAWNDTKLFERVGKIGLSLGLEWGGNWTKFPDLPHLQYTAEYTLGEFQKNYIEWDKFADNSLNTQNLQPKKLKIKESTGLNVRSGPSTSFSILGTLPFDTELEILEQTQGWSRVNYMNGLGWVKSEFLA